MIGYIETIDTLYDLLISDDDINTVTKGGEIDVNKKNNFNLAHVNVVNASFNGSLISFEVAVIAMALRDTVKPTAKDKWTENDNEDTNLNSMLYVLHRLYLKLKNLNETIKLTGVNNIIPFTESHLNVVDGWTMVFNVEYIENESSAC